MSLLRQFAKLLCHSVGCLFTLLMVLFEAVFNFDHFQFIYMFFCGLGFWCHVYLFIFFLCFCSPFLVPAFISYSSSGNSLSKSLLQGTFSGLQDRAGGLSLCSPQALHGLLCLPVHWPVSPRRLGLLEENDWFLSCECPTPGTGSAP